jgi:hypothetical protein
MRNCFLSLCLLLALPFSSFAQFDLSSLYYDSSKSYLKGEEVLLESDPSEIYTSKIDVPAGFPPPNSTYWSTSTEHVGDLTSTYSNDLANPPSSDNIEDVNVSDIGSPPPDEPPTFTETVLSVGFSENSIAEVAIIAAVNADSYLLSEQFDYQLFDFNQTSQKLTFLSPPDYESLIDDNNSDGVYTVVILATNDSGTTNQTLNVSINNVIEAPTLSDGSSASVNFTSGSSGTVYTANATDGAVYSISGGVDSSLFSINSATGVVTFLNAPDFDNPSDDDLNNVYEIEINAANAAGESTLYLEVNTLPSNEDHTSNIAKQIGLSSRGFCGSLSTDPLIAGFIVEGNSSNSLIVTAKGPSLPITEVANPLADPKLYIVDMTTGQVVGEPVDNWQDSSDAAAISSSGRAPTSPLDSAVILKDLTPGAYSAICYGENITGTALVEIYELEDEVSNDSKFQSLSTRGFCGSLLTDPRIVGFIINGEEGSSVDLYLGAKGPSLPSDEVSNPLSDPSLYIVNMATGSVIAGPVDNWQDGEDAATLIEVGRAPSHPNDAALILRDLPPGAYSAVAYGAGDVTGTVLVEAYEIELD